MNNARNPDRTKVTLGKIIEVERRQDSKTSGNTSLTEEWEVSHGSSPTRAAFGLIESAVINDQNHRKSKQVETRLDIEDLFELPSRENSGLDELGGDVVTTTSIPVDTTKDLSSLLSEGHLVINSKVTASDRANGIKEETRVTQWNHRVSETKGSPDATGETVRITKQVKAAADPWPTTNENTLRLSRTQIGVDKYMQELAEAPDGTGVLTSTDDFGFEGYPTETTQKRVDPTFVLPAKDALTIAHELQQKDGFNQIYVKTNVKTGWPTLVSYEHEPYTGKRVLVERTFASVAPTVAVNATPGVTTTVKHTGADRWAIVNRTIDPSVLSTTFQEYHPVEYRFPAYLDEDTPFLTLAERDRTIVNSLRSSAQRLKIPCLFEITYSASVPVISDVFQFKPVDINVNFGEGFNISESGVITDGVTFSLPAFNTSRASGTFSDLQAYLDYLATSTGSIEFTFPPSSPTTTEYKALMGTNVLIADDVSRWKYNLWQRTKVWMKLPNLDLGLTGSLTYS